MSVLTSAFKNEYTKRALRGSGLRQSPFKPAGTSRHYRCPRLTANEGHVVLRAYSGPQIPSSEWEDLEYTTYASDPFTFFAPITSPTGRVEMIGAMEAGKEDLDCSYTPNASKCPTIVAWLDSIGAAVGRVQLLRMRPNTLRECRWGLHLDNNNPANPESRGWIVRVWLELTDDPSSTLVLRTREFDRAGETAVPLPRYQQVVVDSEALWHGGHHRGPGLRYALIASVESGPKLDEWIESQLP